MLDTRWPFVERHEELRVFDRAWRSAQCRVVAIYGGAGVGKSRLAEELLARALAGGRRAARVTATAASATIPLSAITHLIPGDADLSDPVAGFAHIARLLAGSRGTDQWAVLVDDLHLLDAASAALLRHVVDAGVAKLIATVRDGEPPSPAVEALAGDDTVCRIDLTPFSSSAAERVLGAALGAPLTRPAAHRLFEASGGNALYLRELVRGGVAADVLTYNGEIWDLAGDVLPTTPRLGELIGARLAAAPPEARRVLEQLAVCEPVSLADAVALSSTEVVAGLEEAGLIDVRTSVRRTEVALSHPLYGEVLRDELPAVRRRALLLDQVKRIRAHGSRRHDDALHVARWCLAATGTADPRLLYRAAVLARHAHDYEQAAALLEAIADPDRTFASCLLHGDTLVQLGQWPLADTVLTEAQSRAGSEEDFVGVTILRTWNLFWVAARTQDCLAVNDAAREQVTGPAGQRLLALNEASLRAISGHPAAGLLVLDTLEVSVRDAPDVNSWLGAAMARTAGMAYVGRSREAIAWGWSAYAVQTKINDEVRGPAHQAAQLIPVIIAMTDAGDLAEAVRVADRVMTELVDNAAVQTRIWAAVYRGRAEWLAGDAAAARQWYAEAIVQAQQHRQIRPLPQAWAGLAQAAAVLGDLETAESALVQMRAHPFMGHQAGEERLGEAWLHAARGRLAAAREVLTQAATAARETGQFTSEMLILTDVARLGGAADVARRLTELTGDCDGALAPARARFARALAIDDAEELVRVAEEFGTIGARLLAAEAATVAAAVFRRTGRDRRATSAALAARTYAEQCPGVRTPLLAGGDAALPLTAREREVVLLAAADLRSKEIAEALHLSARTVDNHLQRAYAKLGVTRRHQLRAALGLASSTRPS